MKVNPIAETVATLPSKATKHKLRLKHYFISIRWLDYKLSRPKYVKTLKMISFSLSDSTKKLGLKYLCDFIASELMVRIFLHTSSHQTM